MSTLRFDDNFDFDLIEYGHGIFRSLKGRHGEARAVKAAHAGCRSLKWLVAGFYRTLKSLGMDPGLEFKVAMEEAEKLRAHIVYGDADQDRTMQRISQSLTAKA